MKKGFTLIELVVVIAIMAVLSGIILFSVTLYINKGKDSNISGNLVVLIPAGEVFYNVNNSYEGFCGSDIITNTISQMPANQNPKCTDNVLCCNVALGNQAWAACVLEFADTSKAYCVDSRGVKRDIDASSCASGLTECN